MRLTLLGVVFVLAVGAIAYWQHTLLLPLFVGLFALLKSFLKLLSPQFLMPIIKNSIYLNIKQRLIKNSTRVVMLSHRPWRHKLRNLQIVVTQWVKKIISLYLQSALWLRTALALIVLIATASSSYVVLALLIIPQPIVNWLKRWVMNFLNKTGVIRVTDMIWKWVVPAKWQHKWYMYRKWTLGRSQVKTAQDLHYRFQNTQIKNRLFSQPKPKDNQKEQSQ